MPTYVFEPETLKPLDSGSFVPLYVQIADRLSALIQEQGEGAVGKALPSEAECSQRFRVSRPTVRQAMSRLFAQGLISREKGRGTFVIRPKLDHDVSHDFEDEMRSAVRRVKYTVLAWEPVAPPADVAAVFGPEAPEQFQVLRRLRSVDDELVGMEERYLPPSLAAQLSRADVESRSIFFLLGRLNGKAVSRLDIEVSSRAATAELARLLEVQPGAPLLIRTSTFRSADGRPLVHGTTTFLAEHYSFRFSVSFKPGTSDR